MPNNNHRPSLSAGANLPPLPTELDTRFLEWLRIINTPYPVGQSPKDVIWTLNKAKLYRYKSPFPPEKRHPEPLLLVFALMNRPYILDLRPGNSFVEFMVKKGHDVYLIDWGTPGPEDKDLRMEDYVFDYMTRAIRKLKAVSGAEKFNMLGWCIGALLATSYAALRPDSGVHNLILLTPPLDFSDKHAGSFSTWVHDDHFDPDKIVARFGNMPGDLISMGAKQMKPIDSYITTYVRLWDKLDDPRAVAAWQSMNTWINDNPDMAGAFYKELITDLYNGNKLAEGQLVLRGERVDVAQIEANLLMVLAQADHIVPSCQSDAIFPKMGSEDKELVRLPGGHIGLMAGSQAINRTWPLIEKWLAERTA